MISRVTLGIFLFCVLFSCATFASAAQIAQKPNPHERTLSYPGIRKGDQSLLDLWLRISRKPIKLKSKQEWEGFKPAQICSQNVCTKDPNLTCLRAIPSDPDKKCQQFQREKIVKEILAVLSSRGCSIPAAAGGGDSLPSVVPSANNPGPNNNNNNNFPAGNNGNPNNGPLKPGVKPQNPGVPNRPHGGGGNPWIVPAAAGAAGALIAGLPHYNNVPGNGGTPQNNGLLDLNPGKPGKPGVPPGYVPGAPRPSNDQFRVDGSCSEEAMFDLGKKYRESMIQFVKLDDDVRDSFDPDKSTVSLFNSSLEMLNIALLSKSESLKRSSIYILKEWVDAYFTNMKSYFPVPLKAMLDKACNCFLEEEDPSHINRNIKAFLEGAGYFKK